MREIVKIKIMSKFAVPARGERAPGLRCWLGRGRDHRPLGREGVVGGGRGEDAAVGDGGEGIGDEGGRVLVGSQKKYAEVECEKKQQIQERCIARSAPLPHTAHV